MAASRPLDIVARFRTVTTDFNTRQVEKELAESDRAFDRSARNAKDWQRDVSRAADRAGDDLRGKGRFGNVGTEVGEEFSQNFGEAIRSGNPLNALFETATSLGPALGLAGLAAAAGTGIIAGIVGGMQKRQEQLKAAGRAAFDALRDGMVEGAENESVIAEALGLESFDEVVDLAIKEAARLKVPADQIITYYRTAGRVVGPELRAAFREANEAARSANRGMQGAAADTIAAVVEIGSNLDNVEAAWDTGKRKVDALNDSLATTVSLSKKAAYYADKAASSYAKGGSTYQSQVPSAARRREP